MQQTHSTTKLTVQQTHSITKLTVQQTHSITKLTVQQTHSITKLTVQQTYSSTKLTVQQTRSSTKLTVQQTHYITDLQYNHLNLTHWNIICVSLPSSQDLLVSCAGLHCPAMDDVERHNTMMFICISLQRDHTNNPEYKGCDALAVN